MNKCTQQDAPRARAGPRERASASPPLRDLANPSNSRAASGRTERGGGRIPTTSHKIATTAEKKGHKAMPCGKPRAKSKGKRAVDGVGVEAMGETEPPDLRDVDLYAGEAIVEIGVGQPSALTHDGLVEIGVGQSSAGMHEEFPPASSTRSLGVFQLMAQAHVHGSQLGKGPTA